VRSLRRRNSLHACILDAHFFAAESNVKVALIGLGSLASVCPGMLASAMRQRDDVNELPPG
jgi:hypothetical protein